MKYIVRSIKYFAYLGIILTIILVLLSLFGVIGSSLDEIFKDGADSLWKIAGILAVFAAIYPYLGFGKRQVIIPGAYSEIRDELVELMHQRGYILVSEDGDNPVFRLSSPASRITRMFEDRLTFTRTISGFTIEGPSKDLVRVAAAIETKFRIDE